MSQIDQQNADTSAASTRESSWIQSDSSSAQKFTAGRTGKMDKVSVYLSRESAVSDLSVEIHRLDNLGNPDGTLLASETKPVGEVPIAPGWVDVDLSPAPTVKAGTQYALVLAYPGSGHYSWKLTPADLYDGGYLMFTAFGQWQSFESRDLLFKTFVEDTQAPTISSSIPAPNETEVSRTADITASFSEEMKTNTIVTSPKDTSDPTVGTSSNIKLQKYNKKKKKWQPVSGVEVSCNIPCDTVTLHPTSALGANTKHRVTITTGVKDKSGNPLAQNYSWTFTTIGTGSS